MSANVLVLVEKKNTACHHNRPSMSEIQNFVYTSSEDPQIQTLVLMPQGGARCQNLGHLKIFFFSFIESFDLGQQVLIRTGYLCVTSHFRVHDPGWGSQGGGIL